MHESCMEFMKSVVFHAFLVRVIVVFLNYWLSPCFWSCRCVTREPKSSFELERKQPGGEELQSICTCAELFLCADVIFVEFVH